MSKCDSCKHQKFDNNFLGVEPGYDQPGDFHCAKGHWCGSDEQYQFNVKSIEPHEDPWADCKDYESKDDKAKDE